MLTLDHVTVTYADGLLPSGQPRLITALDDASLSADAGTLTAILGPSGSGKSTLLSVAAGLIVPTSGSVTVDGERLDARDELRTSVRRRRIGMVFQQPNLLPALTAVEQLLLVPDLAGESRRQARPRAMALLERVGLAEQASRRPHQLSGGQRQRVAIARSLMASPSVLLADEPTSALDARRSLDVVGLLSDITREQGLATLLVTHDEDCATLADRIVTVRDGRLQPELVAA